MNKQILAAGCSLLSLAVSNVYADHLVAIAGPMTGYENWNYPAFHRAEERLRELYPDDTIINPAAEFNGNTTLTREVYLRRAIENVLKADRLLTLDGWVNSVGACTEVLVAQQIGIEVYHTPTMECDDAAWDMWAVGRSLRMWRGVEK